MPVDLLIAGEFASMIQLLEQQPYLARVVADPAWGLSHGWQAPNRDDVISPYDLTVPLGYRRWPELTLPLEVWQLVPSEVMEAERLDLGRPWLTPPEPIPSRIVAGWSDCWFELKVGLLSLLGQEDICVLAAPGSRWETEASCESVDWLLAARLIAGAEVFLGDCSALHVLAVALGKPVVLVEPMEARWNPIFYPLGQDGPQVTLVKGLDGLPTFDSRHAAETLEKVLAGVVHAER